MTSQVNEDDDLLRAMDSVVIKKPKVNETDIFVLSDENQKNQSMTTQNSIQDNKNKRKNRYEIDQDSQQTSFIPQKNSKSIEVEFEIEQEVEEKFENISPIQKTESIQSAPVYQENQKQQNQNVPNAFLKNFPKKQQKVKNLKKTDFNYKNQSKTRNILDDEQEIGEVGEWVEKTCNQKEKDSDVSDDDEFEQAFQDGEKQNKNKQIQDDKQTFQSQNLPKFIEDMDDSPMRNGNNDFSQDKIKDQQLRANQKVKNIEKGGYKSGNGGPFMKNKLSSKAKFMHLENQEQNPEKDVQKEDDGGEKVILSNKDRQSLKDMNKADKVAELVEDSQNESEKEEHQDVVIIDQERLSSSPQKKNSKIIDEDEWEMINEKALQNQSRRLSNQKEIQQITYIEAWNKVKQTDLTSQLKSVQCNDKKDQSFFQKIFQMCSRSSELNRPSLLNERDQILAFSNVKFDDKENFHFSILYSIYCQLKNTDHCLRYGNHWQDIGFQGTDPASDLRSTGMFSLLQYLGFVNNYKKYLKYAIKQKPSFPLSITLINISKFTLEYLKKGFLADMINQEKQVMNVLNKVYFATFYIFLERFVKENNEEKIGVILQQVQEIGGKQPKKNVEYFMKYIERFYKDHEDQEFDEHEEE